MGSEVEKFKRSGFKPQTPFTSEQVAYLEDLFTSFIMYIQLQIHDLERFKNKLSADLAEIKKMGKKD